jgi:hypothetical protein
MPPLPLEYQGRDLAREFLIATAFRPGWTAWIAQAPTRVNGGQLAFGFYARHKTTGQSYAIGPLVLTLEPAPPDGSTRTRISAMTRFDGHLLHRVGLPG